jgi:FdrA protein
MSEATRELFQQQLKIINVGADYFAQALRQQGVDVEQVDWRPPAGGDPELAALLKKMGVE